MVGKKGTSEKRPDGDQESAGCVFQTEAQARAKAPRGGRPCGVQAQKGGQCAHSMRSEAERTQDKAGEGGRKQGHTALGRHRDELGFCSECKGKY